jgi:beta-phosphoglucomutase
MEFEAVIFDMDGVLCATDESHFQSWKYMAESYGIPFTREENEKLRGLSRSSSLEWILKGRSISEAQKQEMMDQKDTFFQDLVSQMSPAMLSAGVGDLLRELRSAGVKVGVASASRNVKVILRQLRIEAFFQAYCDGNSVSRSKPSPDVYLCAAKALNSLPNTCLAIEDSQAGIQAALAAGMCVVGLGPLERVKKAHAVFEDLSGVRLKDLTEVFEKWCAEKHESYRCLSLP